MSGKFRSAGDAVSEALASFTAMQLEEANDIDDLVCAAAAWVQDIGYTIFRVANALGETAIRDDITDRFFDSAASAEAVGHDLDDLTAFSLARR